MTRPTTAILASIIFATGIAWAGEVRAVEPTIVDLTSEYATKGRSIAIGDHFILGLRENLFTAPARITLTPGVALPVALPSRYSQAGTAYGVDIAAAQGEARAKKTLWLKVAATPQTDAATVLLGYNPVTGSWDVIGRGVGTQALLTGSTWFLRTTVVAAADLATKPGAYGAELTVNAQSTVRTLAARAGAITVNVSPYSISVRAQKFSQGATLVVTPGLALPAPLPTRYKQRADVVQIGLRGDDNALLRAGAGIVITPKVTGNGFYPQRVLFYNPSNKYWEVTRGNVAYVMGYAVVVDDLGEEVGIASWFPDKRDYVAAHNRYPMGTKLKVTNLENGKSTTVKVVSRGPYVRGRVIDLDYTPFAKIRGKNGGLAKVRVTPVDPKVLGESTSPVPASASSDAAVTLPVSATAAIAYDVDTGTVVAGKNVNERHPIASLTKLMTALVYLDRKPTFRNTVTYQKGDSAVCSCLRVSPGETMTTNDLWHAMLIGSANNATRALVRSTKLSEAEFVRLMNAKAKDLGLTSLTFSDPTGLEPANQGSAVDMAKLAAIAFGRPEIAKVAVKASYSFSTINTKKAHTITNQNKMLKTPWQVTGIKTGYIEESGNCLITQVKGKTTGRTVVTVVLGTASQAKQYEDTEKALDIGFANLK